MKRTLSTLGVAVAMVAIMALGLPAQPAGAARPSKVPDLQCGVPVTTSVKLSADLTCSTPVVVPDGTPAVTIDLGGHVLRVDPVPECSAPHQMYPICTITDKSAAATLTNGTVDGNLGAWDGEQRGFTISRVHVTGRVTTSLWGALTLTHDVVDGGVFQFHRASIHDSVIAGGIEVVDAHADTPIDIVRNRITGGVSIDTNLSYHFASGIVAGNDIRDSAGPGIAIGGSKSNQLGELLIQGNTIVGNAGDGIAYAEYSYWPEVDRENGPVTIKGNVVRNNGGHGINLFETTHHGPAVGVIDAGGNRGRGNALDPQCIGVRCGPTDHRLLPDIVWHNPPNITTEIPLGPDQLNATSSVPGTFTYLPPAGTLLSGGGWSLAVHFVPDDLTRYQPVDRAVTIAVYGLRAQAVVRLHSPHATDQRSVTVFLGNGDGTFRPQPSQPGGAGLGGLVLADLNGRRSRSRRVELLHREHVHLGRSAT